MTFWSPSNSNFLYVILSLYLEYHVCLAPVLFDRQGNIQFRKMKASDSNELNIKILVSRLE